MAAKNAIIPGIKITQKIKVSLFKRAMLINIGASANSGSAISKT